MPTEYSLRNHWAVLGLGLLVVGVLLVAGCTGGASSTEDEVPLGKEVVVFVDFSESVRGDDRAFFEREVTQLILPTLAAGDRLLVAPINDKTLTSFYPLIEATFPPSPKFNGWMDNVMKHKRTVRKVEARVKHLRGEIKEQASKAFKKRATSPQTDIFSSLLMAQKLFDGGERRKVLVLMSDMIVDYPPYRFHRIEWSPEKTDEILADLGAKGIIPDLSGVCVYVSGVSASSAQLAGHISHFWQAYFARTGADMNPNRYAHVLLHWPPASACSV